MDHSHPLVSTAPAPAAAGNDIDRRVRAAPGRGTASLSAGTALLSATDWAIYLLVSPVKQIELALRVVYSETCDAPQI